MNVRQSITSSVTDEYNGVSEGHCRWNGSERRTFVQSTGRYHTHSHDLSRCNSQQNTHIISYRYIISERAPATAAAAR